MPSERQIALKLVDVSAT